MRCVGCNAEMILTGLKSNDCPDQYGGVYYSQLSIDQTTNHEKAIKHIHKRLIKMFYGGDEEGYSEDYGRGAWYGSGKDKQDQEDMEKTFSKCCKRPQLFIEVCDFCGISGAITTDMAEIREAIEVCNNWLDVEENERKKARLSNQAQSKKDLKKKHLKQIETLQKKLKKLDE